MKEELGNLDKGGCVDPISAGTKNFIRNTAEEIIGYQEKRQCSDWFEGEYKEVVSGEKN